MYCWIPQIIPGKRSFFGILQRVKISFQDWKKKNQDFFCLLPFAICISDQSYTLKNLIIMRFLLPKLNHGKQSCIPRECHLFHNLFHLCIDMVGCQGPQLSWHHWSPWHNYHWLLWGQVFNPNSSCNPSSLPPQYHSVTLFRLLLFLPVWLNLPQPLAQGFCTVDSQNLTFSWSVNCMFP